MVACFLRLDCRRVIGPTAARVVLSLFCVDWFGAVQKLPADERTPTRSVSSQKSKTGSSAATEAELRQIEREIAAIRSTIERLKLWGSCTVVLGSRTSSQAVALDEIDTKFRVVDIAEGEFVSKALTYAWKNGVDRVWNPEAQRLTTEILRTVKPREELTSALAERLRSSIWKVPEYAGVPGSERDPQVVLFHTVHDRQQRVGMFLRIQPDELVYRPLAATETKAVRTEIVPGSLRIDTGAELLAASAVEQGGSFLEFCILQAAHRLSPADGKPSHPVVAVHVDVRCEPAAASKADTSRSVRRATQRFREVGSLLGIDATDEPGELCTALSRMARRAEDRIYDKLVSLGIAITERKFLDNVLSEQGERAKGNRQAVSTVDRTDLLKMARQHEATHVLVARIEEPAAANSQYYLSMRLIDLRSNQDLLSLSGENLAPREEVTSPIFLHSGQLALARWRDRNKKEAFPGIEQPAVIPVGVATNGGKLPTQFLVLQETAGVGDDAAFRPLFSRKVLRFPADQVEVVPLTNDPMQRLAENPELRSQVLRYIVWRIVPPAMTPAGRIVAAFPEANAVETTLGLRQGLGDGAKLRVARPVELLPTALQTRMGKMPLRLPAMLSVTELEENGSRASLGRWTKKGYWDEEAMRPAEGDLVFARYVPQHRVAVYPPYAPSTSGQANNLESDFDWNDRTLMSQMRKDGILPQKLAQAGQSLADQTIRTRLRDAFKTLGVQVVSDLKYKESRSKAETIADALQHDATLLCWGRMFPVVEKGTLRWRVEMRLEEIDVQSDRPQRGQMLTELEPFTIARDGKDW